MDIFNRKFNTEVERVLSVLEQHDPTTEKYQQGVESLRVLCEARSKKALPIEHDGLLRLAGNLLGIGLILYHERLNVISTRALGLVIKPK
jgi:hypothetical protein